MKDKYNIEELEKLLEYKGYNFYYFAETESTMNVINQHAKAGERNMILALADHQTAGVGRLGRVWRDTPYCSLMFSVLFQIPQSSVAVFADLAALTVCEALVKENGLASIRIKYPNDLVIDGRKLGGILVKNIYDEKLSYLGTNLGVGVNVHYDYQELKNFPTDYPAASLDEALGKMADRGNLLIAIAEKLRYLETETKTALQNSSAMNVFQTKWKEISAVLGREIVVLKNDRIIDKGKVLDTEIGRGIGLQTESGMKWISLFETDMKARVVN